MVAIKTTLCRSEGTAASQRSLHNAPIFRLLLKVAVKGTHQCDLHYFCGNVKFPNNEHGCFKGGTSSWRGKGSAEFVIGRGKAIQNTFRHHSCRKKIQHTVAYLLGLLAMIKCSICSYQCDNWYISNWRFACHIYFSLGRSPHELAQGSSRVALTSHIVSCSSPFWVIMFRLWCDWFQFQMNVCMLLRLIVHMETNQWIQ